VPRGGLASLRKGDRLESWTKRWLQQRGCKVYLTAKPEPIDMIAFLEGEIYLVECKASEKVGRNVYAQLNHAVEGVKLHMLDDIYALLVKLNDGKPTVTVLNPQPRRLRLGEEG